MRGADGSVPDWVGIGPCHPEVTLQELQNSGCFRSLCNLFLQAFENQLSTLEKTKTR
jgi:hypothetical protein